VGSGYLKKLEHQGQKAITGPRGLLSNFCVNYKLDNGNSSLCIGDNLFLFKELALFDVYGNTNYSEEILMHYLYVN